MVNHISFFRDTEKMRDILNLHIVKDRLTIDKIKKNNVNAVSWLRASINIGEDG